MGGWPMRGEGGVVVVVEDDLWDDPALGKC
jgi:hypothetical protein